MKITDKDQDFCIATLGENGEYVIYNSRNFKLSEIDMLSLIKMLIVERRSKLIGEKLLAVYQDGTRHRQQITLDRLRKIGIDKEDQKPQQPKNASFKSIIP
jgi:hypothetical protein